MEAPLKIEAPESDYLYIAASQIQGAGSGLFTAIPIYKNEIIAYFAGELILDALAQERRRLGLDGYFITMPDGGILDSNFTDCFAKFANDPSGRIKSPFPINSEIRLDDEGHVCLIASKNIKVGSEIFCSYGEKYWEKR